MDIKPINTKYNKYNFRSRIEARWAVFFDKLGWEWRYEDEGYQLESVYYLPDFYFPELNTYAEVKGKAFTDEELNKCKLLSADFPVILLVGPPNLKTYPILNGGGEDTEVVFMPKGSKYHPFYYTYEFWPDYFDETTDAVTTALSKRFEFNDREV